MLALLSATLLLAVVTAARARAGDTPSGLDEQMADYVLNFTKFVEWPEGSHPQELVICVAGNPGLYAALREAVATPAGAGPHHLSVRTVKDARSAAGCHLLYIETASHLQVAQLGTSAPMLTVSDGSGFTHAGGDIELFTQQNRLRFIVNLENARHAGLHISSSLLQLAAAVEGGETK